LGVEQKLSARSAGILPAAAPKGNPAWKFLPGVGASRICCNLRVASAIFRQFTRSNAPRSGLRWGLAEIPYQRSRT